jgi:uncharacterized protein CbrC (UPF0167 family)
VAFRAACDSCGQRRPRYETVAVLGPLDIARWHECAECVARGDAAAIGVAPLDEAAALLALGPIRFDDLRASLATIDGTESPELLAWLAEQVAGIARHHGQPLPPDIHAFVERHADS